MSEKPYAVVVGAANMDICAIPGGELRSRDSNPGTVVSSPGGVARNIAENLVRFGVDCRLVAAIGNDRDGQLLLEQGAAAGIDMRYVLQLDTEKTSNYVSVLDSAGDMFVAVNDMAIVDQLRPEYLQANEQMLRKSSIVVADANVSEDTFAYLSNTVVEQPLIVDAVSVAKAVRIKRCLGSVHTLKASRIEAEALSGITLSTPDELPQLATWFHNRGVSRVFVTLGPDGVFYSGAGEQGLEPAQKVESGVANANGAGDAFLAGIAYAWLQDRALTDSVRFAISAASLALSHQATINPDMSVAAVDSIRVAQYGA